MIIKRYTNYGGLDDFGVFDTPLNLCFCDLYLSGDRIGYFGKPHTRGEEFSKDIIDTDDTLILLPSLKSSWIIRRSKDPSKTPSLSKEEIDDSGKAINSLIDLICTGKAHLFMSVHPVSKDKEILTFSMIPPAGRDYIKGRNMIVELDESRLKQEKDLERSLNAVRGNSEPRIEDVMRAVKERGEVIDKIGDKIIRNISKHSL